MPPPLPTSLVSIRLLVKISKMLRLGFLFSCEFQRSIKNFIMHIAQQNFVKLLIYRNSDGNQERLSTHQNNDVAMTEMIWSAKEPSLVLSAPVLFCTVWCNFISLFLICIQWKGPNTINNTCQTRVYTHRHLVERFGDHQKCFRKLNSEYSSI